MKIITAVAVLVVAAAAFALGTIVADDSPEAEAASETSTLDRAKVQLLLCEDALERREFMMREWVGFNHFEEDIHSYCFEAAGIPTPTPAPTSTPDRAAAEERLRDRMNTPTP